MNRLTANYLASLGLISLLAASAAAQGLLVVVDRPLPRPIIRPVPRPQPPATYKIKALQINARITDQVARVQVAQKFVNTGSRQMEVTFIFPLPYDGAVDSLTLLVDGKEYPAKLLPADEARKIYEGFVRRNQDPALLEWIGTGMFKTSVFPVPAGAERTVMMRYSQLLRKDHNLTDFLFPLGTAKYTSKPVEKVSIDATIESGEDIKSVYSPTHLINVKRPDKKRAIVRYEEKDTVPSSDFRLFYDIAKGKLGASVLSYRPDKDEDGYLLLLASPQIKARQDERPKKTVIFVVDRSGSMSGKKIEQVKEALKFVLNNLREGDLFNIVAYDSSVESFRPELEKYGDETRKQALGFVEGIYAGGATNIDGALTAALDMIQDDSRPSFVLFLTDGLPTAGETKEAKIVENAKSNNKLRARVISFGVGYDVNSRLLDRISRTCFGRSEYVRPNEDIETHVSRLYSRISAPVMTDVAVKFEFDEVKVEEGKPVNRLFPKEVHDLFEGEQLVLAGRYKKPGLAKVVITGKVGDKQQKFDFPAKLAKTSKNESYAFVEKLWAMRRIGEIIDELDLKGKNDELIKELVALSTQHGILTPYTSFLADDSGTIQDLAAARQGAPRGVMRADRALNRLAEAGGRAGFSQRAAKKAFQEAAQAPASSGFGGFGGGSGARFRSIEADEEVETDAVRVVGQESIYRRGRVWVASSAADVDLERDKDKIVTVERFSDEYFTLIRENTRSENLLLAQQQPGEELIVRLRGQTYRIR
jgi:Ca-activated chloride channel family protein